MLSVSEISKLHSEYTGLLWINGLSKSTKPSAGQCGHLKIPAFTMSGSGGVYSSEFKEVMETRIVSLIDEMTTQRISEIEAIFTVLKLPFRDDE